MATVISPVQYQFECGDFDWRVRSIVLEERLSQPLCAELRVLTPSIVVASDLLGVAARVTITRDEASRSFVGEVTRAELFATASGETHAHVCFEPLLARARRATRYRIFQDIKVVDIVCDLLGAVGECEFEVVLDQERDVRDYCVQYGESDLDFAMRLLEDEGIAWFLEFSGPRPVMHLVEATRGFGPIAIDDPELRVIPEHFEEAEVESIQALTIVRRVPGPAVVERNWKWILGATVFEQTYPAEATGPSSERVDPRRVGSPMEVMTTMETEQALKASVQREQQRLAARAALVSGTSNVSALAVGSYFLFDVGQEAVEPLLVRSVLHRGDCPEVELAGGQHRASPNYTNTFECQPLAVQHRPEHTIPRPRLHSLHTAVVTGPKGEDIHVDYNGRITVRMHWDRSDGPPELSSCWLRVAQMWGGNGWGSNFIPRVGMEVLVAFIDGDPDRPICVGSVYNGTHSHPYPMPDDRTKSTIRTQSTPGGDGYNELTFQDAAGAEQIYVRAQRDLRTQVLSNESRSVGADQTLTVGHDRSITVDGDQHTTIKGNQTLAVDGGGTEGLAGTSVTVKGAVEVRVTDIGTVLIDAAERIELRVGGSSIVMDGMTIQFQAGAGTMQRLDETAVVLAGRGALMRLGSSVMVNAASGATLQMDDKQTFLASNAGSLVMLTDGVLATAGLGATLELTADAALNAASIAANAGQGATLTLDANAALAGMEASCTGAGGSLTVGPSGAALDGTKVDVTAASVATLVSALVKIN